jgi:hypothetical protein
MNRAHIPRTQLLVLAITGLAGTARLLPAQIRSPMSPTGIAPVSLARSAASAAPGESFAMALSSSVQSTPRAISDSTPGASQPYTGSVMLTPTWDLNNNRQISIYAYVSQPFTSASGTLASSVLEASAIGGSGSANGAWNPFSSVVDGHIAGVTLTDLMVHGAGKTVNDASERLTVTFRLNTTNTAVVPGIYTGVVTFGAHVQ